MKCEFCKQFKCEDRRHYLLSIRGYYKNVEGKPRFFLNESGAKKARELGVDPIDFLEIE